MISFSMPTHYFVKFPTDLHLLGERNYSVKFFGPLALFHWGKQFAATDPPLNNLYCCLKLESSASLNSTLV